jgi:hypothetical protein
MPGCGFAKRAARTRDDDDLSFNVVAHLRSTIRFPSWNLGEWDPLLNNAAWATTPLRATQY